MGLTGVKSQQDFKELHRSWIDEGLAKVNTLRDGRWTESLAVGGEAFVKEIRETLGAKAIGRSVISDGEKQQLREGIGTLVLDCISRKSMARHFQ